MRNQQTLQMIWVAVFVHTLNMLCPNKNKYLRTLSCHRKLPSILLKSGITYGDFHRLVHGSIQALKTQNHTNPHTLLLTLWHCNGVNRSDYYGLALYGCMQSLPITEKIHERSATLEEMDSVQRRATASTEYDTDYLLMQVWPSPIEFLMKQGHACMVLRRGLPPMSPIQWSTERATMLLIALTRYGFMSSQSIYDVYQRPWLPNSLYKFCWCSTHLEESEKRSVSSNSCTLSIGGLTNRYSQLNQLLSSLCIASLTRTLHADLIP